VTFGQRPKYEALSYTWGDETQRRDILLGGHSFSVTKNLYDALCCLRHTSEPRQLWADAICINQKDIPERNRQLYLMPFVYERAKTVLVWLGLYEMESARNSSTTPSVSEKAQPVLDSLRLSSDDDLIKSICCNPYWDRLWIIQEVAQARRLMVHLSDSQIGWQELLPLLHGSPYFERSRVERLEYHLANKYQKFLKLENLLEAHKHALCKDPRDKVYGLLGLDAGWLYFSVDYRKSLYEVWKDTVLFQRNAPQRPPVSCVAFSQLVKDCLGREKISSTEELLRDLSFEISPKLRESVSADDQVSAEPSPGTLPVSGRAIGRILCTGPSYSQIINDPSIVAEWTWMIQTHLPVSEQPEAWEENESFLEALEELDEKDLTIVSSCHFECPSLSGMSIKDKSKCDCPGSRETTIDEITRSNCDCLESTETIVDGEITKGDEPSGKPSCGNLQPLYPAPTMNTTSPYKDGTCLYLLDTLGKGTFGRIGLGPSNAQAGDWIYIIGGLKKVAVLRQTSDRMKLIGTGGLGPSIQHSRALHTDGHNLKRLFTEDCFSSLDCKDELHLFSSELFHLLD
jgi:hypothetical protein